MMFNQALGASIVLDIVPLSGAPYRLSGASPEMVKRSAPISASEVTAGIDVEHPTLGDVLTSGTIRISLFADDARGATVSHSSVEVDDTDLDLVGLISLLSISATRLEATAEVSGSCACGDQEASLRAIGSTTTTETSLECFIGSALQLPADPAPGTELLHALGVRVMVNEQTLATDEAGGLRLVVNAVHIYLTDVLLSGLGSASGEVILGQATAGISCGVGAEELSCSGDCNGDGAVTVDELLTSVSIALGQQEMGMCEAIDMDGSRSVTVDEILAAVDRVLLGCPQS